MFADSSGTNWKWGGLQLRVQDRDTAGGRCLRPSASSIGYDEEAIGKKKIENCEL